MHAEGGALIWMQKDIILLVLVTNCSEIGVVMGLGFEMPSILKTAQMNLQTIMVIIPLIQPTGGSPLG